MKYVFTVILALICGYALYPYVNRPEVEKEDEFTELFQKFLLEEASEFAKSTDPENKMKAADQMYQKMSLILNEELDLESEKNLPAEIKVTVKPEVKKAVAVAPKTLPVRRSAPEKKEIDFPKNQTIAEKYHTNTLDRNSVMTFNELPFLSDKDSRIKKLAGVFEGKVKSFASTRTGDEERITMKVNQDKTKEMTITQIVDSYDNFTLDISKKTSLTFKSVPGDENLLLMLIPDGSIILDLRRFPILTGKVLSLSQVKGEFQMESVQKK